MLMLSLQGGTAFVQYSIGAVLENFLTIYFSLIELFISRREKGIAPL